MKATSKGSLAGCLVHLDSVSTNRLAQQNHQIPEHANNRTIPSWPSIKKPGFLMLVYLLE